MEEKLREAACFGDIDSLQILLRQGVKVNDKHKMNGWTALHWAAKRNEAQVVKVRKLNKNIITFCLDNFVSDFA